MMIVRTQRWYEVHRPFARVVDVVFRPRISFLLTGLLVACGSSSPVPPQEQPAATARPSPELQRGMKEHFEIATWARDVVIAGELDPLREPLRELAALEYGEADPADQRRLSELQGMSAAAAKAATVAEAAAQVAAMAALCGDCHRERARGPLVTVAPDTDLDAAEIAGDPMSRHRLGAEQLWQGLMGPSEQAYHRGARLIARMPAVSSDPRYAAGRREIAKLAARAEAARSGPARTQAYGELLARCAQCHAVTGPSPSCFERHVGDGSCRLVAR